jgi:hypothetical protein
MTLRPSVWFRYRKTAPGGGVRLVGLEQRFGVRILISRGFEAVNTIFGENFGFGGKHSFSTRT